LWKITVLSAEVIILKDRNADEFTMKVSLSGIDPEQINEQ